MAVCKCTGEHVDSPQDVQLTELLGHYRDYEGGLIPVLQGAQEIYGYLPAAHTNGDLFLYFPILDTLVCGGPVTTGQWPVLDIRQDNEWETGHVPGALHVELADLRGPAARRLPAEPLTVMCGHGERAMTAASILEAAGRRDVAVLAGGPADWAAAMGVHLAVG